MSTALRLKVGGSALLLLVTAAYHGSGFREVASLVKGAELPPDLTGILGGLWLFFSWHLAVLAIVPLAAAASGAGWMRPAVIFCGIVALGDFVWVYGLAGWFAGTLLLLLAALGLLVGGFLWRGSDADPAPAAQ